ncbi:MAG: hypothetical protein ACRCTR_06250 [Actinomycetota bacterium]
MADEASWRSPERAAAVVMRTTAARRDELKAIAAGHGLSLQAYLEWKLLDLDAPPARREPGRPRQDAPLPLMDVMEVST